MQTTIKQSTTISGIGLHSGSAVNITFIPAEMDRGIVFRTSNGKSIEARFDNVQSTNMSTKLSNSDCTVDLVEHLMAALWGCNIDNMIIEIDANEVPIMKGNAKSFIDEIMKVDIIEQDIPRRKFKIKNPIEVREDDKYVIIKPHDRGLFIDMTIDFDHPLIGKQRFIFDSLKNSFIDEIAPARTFGFMKDLEYLNKNGLGLGASLDNCIGLTDNGIANENSLLFPDEFVRHKILDCIGDLFLSGYYLDCHVVAYKPSHKLNNIALRELFDYNM